MPRYVILCQDAHKHCSELSRVGIKNFNTLCGANIQCQFPLIWHSLFQVGGSFVKPSMSSLTLVNILSFKLRGFLHYIWKVNRRLPVGFLCLSCSGHLSQYLPESLQEPLLFCSARMQVA